MIIKRKRNKIIENKEFKLSKFKFIRGERTTELYYLISTMGIRLLTFIISGSSDIRRLLFDFSIYTCVWLTIYTFRYWSITNIKQVEFYFTDYTDDDETLDKLIEDFGYARRTYKYNEYFVRCYCKPINGREIILCKKEDLYE